MTSREPDLAELEGTQEGDDPTRAAILTTTLRLLEQHGYGRVTTDLIASEARVSKATIYRYWASKQELVVESVRLRFPQVDVPDLGSFAEEVRYVLEARMENYRQPGMPRLVAGLVGAASTDPILLEAFERWIEQLSMTLRRVIQRGMVRGDVRPDADIYALESLIAGVVARSVTTQRALSQAAVEHIAELLERAAASPDGAPSLAVEGG
jgi:AcrR family transcriptional regulator